LKWNGAEKALESKVSLFTEIIKAKEDGLKKASERIKLLEIFVA